MTCRLCTCALRSRYVNGSEEGRAKAKAKAERNPGLARPTARDRDSNEFLFSLRALDRNFEWFEAQAGA